MLTFWNTIAAAAITLVFVPPAAASSQISDAQLEQYRQQGARLGLTPAQVTQVFRFIDSNEGVIARAARENRVSEQAFREIALELGLRNYGADPNLLIDAIVKSAKDAAKYEAQIANLRSLIGVMQASAARTAAETALARADAAYKAGDLDGAEAALEELIDLRNGELVEAYDAWEAAHEAALELASARGDLERLEVLAARGPEARRLRRERREEADRKADWWGWFTLANGYNEQGDLQGDNDASLERAIAIYLDEALPLVDRARDRDAWARTQNNLGIALEILGRRESGTARLEEAVSILRLVQEEWTRERVPLYWAKTQNNLGIALWALGTRESGTARLEEAISAYCLALEERTRERAPFDWAITQTNLGIALETLGSRESGTARLEEAVTAYHLALEEIKRERVPLDWAKIQTHLGLALLTLGSRESGTARLEVAISTLRLALEEQTRERAPLDWAATQINLGMALQTLGSRESGTARLEQAISAYRLALEEQSRESGPLDWAKIQNNLGNGLWALGTRESGTARLEEAVSAYRLALEERTRERVPLDWAQSSYFGALVLLELARRTGESAFREQARAQLEEVRAWADATGHGAYYRAASARIAELERDEDPEAGREPKPREPSRDDR